jgi:hypothetical protein
MNPSWASLHAQQDKICISFRDGDLSRQIHLIRHWRWVSPADSARQNWLSEADVEFFAGKAGPSEDGLRPVTEEEQETVKVPRAFGQYCMRAEHSGVWF